MTVVDKFAKHLYVFRCVFQRMFVGLMSFLRFRAEEDASAMTPVLNEDGVSYVFIKHNNLYCAVFPFLFCFPTYSLFSVMTITKKNSNCVAILSFLYRLVEVLPFSAPERSKLSSYRSSIRCLKCISKSWKRKASATTLSLSTSCWTRSWTLAIRSTPKRKSSKSSVFFSFLASTRAELFVVCARAQIHHAGESRAGASAAGHHQPGELAPRGHRAQEERNLPRRH